MKFSEIQALFEEVKKRNPKAQGLTLEEFAKMGAEATGDPEMARVANAGVFENTLRGWNQSLNRGIAAVTPDETLGNVFGNIAEAVGVNRETGESVGRSLPRQVVNVGTMAIPGVGPALSFGLSAADTYDETGSLWQAGIAGAAPMVVGKAMQLGGNKALASAAARPFWQKLGVTGGRDVVREVTEEVGGRLWPIGTKVTDKVIEAMPDKMLRYAGAQAAGQATGMGLDVLAQGPDAVFNKDYLFANVVGNLAFAPLDAGDFIGRKVIEGKDYQLPPEATPVRTEDQQRNFEFQSILDGLDVQERKRMERAAGLDVAAQVLGERKLVDINKSFDDEVSRQRALLESDWEELKANEPAIGQFKLEDVLAKPDMVIEELAPASSERLKSFNEAVKAAEQLKQLRLKELPNLGKSNDLLGVSLGELKLPEGLLQKPVAERTFEDYKTSLDGKVSERGQEVMFVMHKLIAGDEAGLLAGPHKEMAEEVKKVLRGEPTKFAGDRSFVSMALWATGKMPKTDTQVEKKVKQKVTKEGKTPGEAVKEVNKAQLKRVRGADVKPRKKQEAVTNRVNEMQRAINEAGVAVKKTPEQQAVLDAYLFANSHPDNDGSEDTQRALLSSMAKSWATYPEPTQRLQNFKNQVAKILENRKKAAERKTQPLGVKENEGAVSPEDEAVVIPEKLDPEDEVIEEEEVQDVVTEVVNEVDDKAGDLQDKLVMQKMYEYISVKAKVSQSKAKELAHRLNQKDFQKLYGAITKAMEMKKASAEGANDFRVGSQKLMSLDSWADTLLASQGFDSAEAAQLRDHFKAIAEMFASPEVRYGHLQELSGDVKFARASAGAFDFGMAEYKDGKLLRPGKGAVTLRKDKTLSLQEFKVAGGQLGMLADAEIEFYKQLVPTAFEGDRVNVKVLWEKLNILGEQVKVVTYGQNPEASLEKQALDKLKHDWLDTLPGYVQGYVHSYDAVEGDMSQLSVNAEIELAKLDQEKLKEFARLSKAVSEEPNYTGPRATSYYNQISPFDTKKFPVMRVDVSLPKDRRDPDEAKTKEERYAIQEANRKELWTQDNLHENLPNTLGWAMVQTVPDPKTGEPVMFVGELQSRWGQEINKKLAAVRKGEVWSDLGGTHFLLDRKTVTIKPDEAIKFGFDKSQMPLHKWAQQNPELAIKSTGQDHPLLPIHQNLILKSVIREAQKRGINKIAISDAETAMMTEMHDRNAQPEQFSFRNREQAEAQRQGLIRGGYDNVTITEELGNLYPFVVKAAPKIKQEGGMRLAYDTTLPSLMKKLVGDGQMEDFGKHKNTESGSPVFRNPDGTPKSSITGLAFDISTPSERINTLFARSLPATYAAAATRTRDIFFNQAQFYGKLVRLYRHETDWSQLPVPSAIRDLVNQSTQRYKTTQLGKGTYYSRNPDAWKNYRGDGGRASHPSDELFQAILNDAESRAFFGISDKKLQALQSSERLDGVSQKARIYSEKLAIESKLQKIIFKFNQEGPRIVKTIEVPEKLISKQKDFESAQSDQSPIVENISENEILIREGTDLKTLISKASLGKPSILQQASLLAHEHSHILFSKARSGAFGPEVQSKVSDFEAWVKTMNPHEAESFVDVLGDVWLGKEWKDLPGVGDVMKNIRNEDGKVDAEEVMANVFGAFAAGISKPRNPTKFYTMMPRVVRDVFDWVMKQVQGTVKAVEMYGKFGWDREKVKRAKSVGKVFDEVRKGARNAERNLSDLAELANLRGSDVLDKVDVMYAKGRYGSSGKGMEKLSYLFDNVVMRMGSLAATYDGLQEPFVAMKDFSPLNADLTAQAFAALGMGNYSHTGLSVKKDGSWMRIRKSPELHKLASQINVETQMMKKNPVVQNADGSTSFDKSVLSPELKARLEQFSPEAQRVVAEYFVNRARLANPIVHGTIVGKEWDRQTDLLHEVLFESKYGEFGGQFEKSKEWAQRVMRSVRQGDQAGLVAELRKIVDPAARREIGEYVEAVAAKVNTLKGEYESNPNFGSLRRFQPIKVKWVKDGKVQNMQATTAAEAEKMDAELRAEGWTPQSVRITDFKARGSEVFDTASRLRVKDMEDRVKMKLQALAIPDEFKLELEKDIDFVGMLERTENAQSVFSTKVQRRFAEGVEDLHVLEQDMLWMSKAIYASNRNALDAKVRVALKNPKLDNYLDAKRTFAQGYENFKTQNHDWLRKLSKANAAYFIGFNIPGHIAELMQPVMTHMAEMRYAGVKSLDAVKIILGASKDLAGFYKRNMKKFAKGEEVHLWDDWKDPQEREMLFKLKHVINANPLNYAFEDAGFEQQKIIEAAEFGKEQSLLDAVKNPATSYANWALKFYGLFTRHNAIMGLLNGYRAYRSLGVKHEDAMEKVGLFETVVNKSGGKADRQVLPFKNNAVLGHLFYGLQGYTTGWVSQLATYFRHGYRAENYEGFKGNPAAIKNARDAFKTMLLAQLGAAGVMGMPFVGAITTLLEELTGDDIRGKMYEALDSVTNDPLLSQAASHGVSTALAERMGIPADLHGRFAIGGLLGFNAYDGFSATSLLGPTAGAINSMWNLGKTYAQEQDLQKALSAGGPTGLRNIAKALDAELPLRNENALSTALGFNSPQVRKEREFSRIAMKRNEKAARDISMAARRVQDSLSRGSAVTQSALRAEAMKLVDEEKDLIPMMKKIGAKVKLFEEQRLLPKDIREVATPESAAGLSRVAKAMGVRLPASQEVEREQLKAGVSRIMGLPYNMRLQQAQQRDYESELNPLQTR